MGKGEWLSMKCWHCNKELIWGGDHDIEERIKKESRDYIRKKGKKD